VLGRGSVLSVQFHPEKSGPNGLRMLWNFAMLVERESGIPARRAAGVS
jgi:imidazoleglycerol phosphate synthase glutamine amidotransferase subunit HisH